MYCFPFNNVSFNFPKVVPNYTRKVGMAVSSIHLLIIKIQEFIRPFFSEIKQHLWLLIDRNVSEDRVKINYHTVVPIT